MRKPTKPPTPKPDPAPFTEEWWYEFSQVSFLLDQIDPDAPQGAETADLMTRALRATEHDLTEENAPPAAELREAAAAFHRLPSDVRRGLLRGWHMDPWPVWAERLTDLGWSAALTVEPASGLPGRTAIFSHELVRTDSTMPVQVHVRIGTPSDVVRRGLLDVLRMVEDRWTDMVTDDDQRKLLAKEKGDAAREGGQPG